MAHHRWFSTKKLLNVSAAVFIALSTFSYNALSDDLICRMPGGIDGYSSIHERANGFLNQKKVRNVEQVEVFITISDEKLYMESNFASPDFEIPTKILSDSVRDVDLLFQNILGAEYLRKIGVSKYDKAYKKDVRFYVDQKVLASSDKNKLKNLDQCENVFLIDNMERRWITQVVSTKTSKKRFAKIDTNIFTDLDDAKVFSGFYRLKSVDWSPEKLKIISLVDNTDTKEKVKDLFGENHLQLKENSLESLKELINKNKDNTIAIVGHTEKDQYVVRDSKNKIVFSVDIKELDALVKNTTTTLLHLGCETAISSDGTSLLKKVNSLDVVSRLHEANKAKNVGDFFEKFASSKEDSSLAIKVSGELIDNWKEKDVIVEVRDKKQSTNYLGEQVGQIRISNLYHPPRPPRSSPSAQSTSSPFATATSSPFATITTTSTSAPTISPTSTTTSSANNDDSPDSETNYHPYLLLLSLLGGGAVVWNMSRKQT